MGRLIVGAPFRESSASGAGADPVIGPGAGVAFERLTRLAAAMLRVRSARVYSAAPPSLELRGAFPPAAEPREEPTSAAVALEVLRTGHAARSPAVVPSPPVSPRIGESGASVLGVPLLGSHGTIVGALTVADPGNRQWNPVEVDSLADLAVAAMAEVALANIEAHRADAGFPPAATSPARVRRGITPRGMPDPPRLRDSTLLMSIADTSPGLDRGPSSAMGTSADQRGDPEADGTLVEVIRHRIVGALHLGALRAGDRLPSIRQTARAFAVTPYAVLQSYAELEVEGLVERRERSGVFVAEFEISNAAGLPETGAWLTDVLTQACQHQVKIPHLPDLIRRWTSAVRVRCACVESCLDSRIALALEVTQQFGIEATQVVPEARAAAIREADLVITTAYHAAEVGAIAVEHDKPMLIATINPVVLGAALNHLRERDLTVICVDAVYGERLRALNGGAYRKRVRVITVEDTDALAGLDRSEPVLLTPAARQRVSQPNFRLIAPLSPAYSIDFARKVAEALVRINLQGARA